MSVPGLPGVFVIGDAALVLGRDGKPLPGLAAVAISVRWLRPTVVR